MKMENNETFDKSTPDVSQQQEQKKLAVTENNNNNNPFAMLKNFVNTQPANPVQRLSPEKEDELMQLDEIDELLVSGEGEKERREDEAEDEDDNSGWTKITAKRAKRRGAGGGISAKDASAAEESSGYDENGSPPLSEERRTNARGGKVWASYDVVNDTSQNGLLADLPADEIVSGNELSLLRDSPPQTSVVPQVELRDDARSPQNFSHLGMSALRNNPPFLTPGGAFSMFRGGDNHSTTTGTNTTATDIRGFDSAPTATPEEKNELDSRLDRVIMNNMISRPQQTLHIHQNQRFGSDRRKRDKKANKKEKSTEFFPTDMDGYFGDKSFDDVLRHFEQAELDNGSNKKGPGKGKNNNGNNNNNEQKQPPSKKQQQKQTKSATESKQRQSQPQFSASAEDEETEMEVEIELDKEDGGEAKTDEAKEENAANPHEAENEEDTATDTTNPPTSTHEMSEEKEAIQSVSSNSKEVVVESPKKPSSSGKQRTPKKEQRKKSPLLERIPKNVLKKLEWRCPITICNPFVDKPTTGDAERNDILKGPAEPWLELSAKFPLPAELVNSSDSRRPPLASRDTSNSATGKVATPPKGAAANKNNNKNSRRGPK